MPIEPPDLATGESATPASHRDLERDESSASSSSAIDAHPSAKTEIRSLKTGHDSLAYGVPNAKPGTIFVLSRAGGVAIEPGEGRTVAFGRHPLEVDVRVGEDDPYVGRRQGMLTYRQTRWWLTNTGRLPIRMPYSRMLRNTDEPVPLEMGYTPLFLSGRSGRQHLIEVVVTDSQVQSEVVDSVPVGWRLVEDERLVLATLAQKYLSYEASPLPLSWQQVTEHMNRLQPGAGWTPRRVEEVVDGVRTRLLHAGVPGLAREEIGDQPRYAILDNLITELIRSTTLVPTDLAPLKLA
ncbi:FHA domain-containing protein [Amycolatopsis plumensis]|uniref:FHA domain-containing protein n=1 Tax=Amycolatopsis plumensis TaxID=236508 RepID=A0ABV5U3R5_9PSEU